MGMICGSPARPTMENIVKNNDKEKKPFSRTNVVIAFGKNITEEYQSFNPLDGKVHYGKLFPNSQEHPLIQNKYYLVADREVDMDGRPLQERPNKVYQKLPHVPIYGMAQPNKEELKNLLDLFQTPNTSILLFNLREEPVLFLSGSDLSNNTVTYSIREKERLQSLVHFGFNAKHAALNEIAIRKEILNHAAMEESTKFCFYNSLSNSHKEPHSYNVICEDFLLTSEEVYHQLQFEYPNLQYHRCCFPWNGAPTEKLFDEFLTALKAGILEQKSKNQTQILLICKSGLYRSSLAMVISALFYGHVNGFPNEVSSSPYKNNSKKPNLELGEFNVIKMLISQLPDGLLVKHQVDMIIDECKDIFHLRQEINNAKNEFDKLDTASQHTKEGRAKRKLVRNHLECYFYLICLNSYVAEQIKQNFPKTFSQWMLQHPSLYRLLAFLDVTPQKLPELLKNSFLVHDNLSLCDILGTRQNIGVSNVHRMEGLPLFGMAQPALPGLEKFLEYLTKVKKYTHVYFINLRNNLCSFIENEPYYLSYKSDALRPRFLHPDDTHFDDLELEMTEQMRHTPISLIKDIKKEPEHSAFTNVFSTKEIFQTVDEKFGNVTYFRVALPSDYATNENVLDDMIRMFTEVENKRRGSVPDTKLRHSSSSSSNYTVLSRTSSTDSSFKKRQSISSYTKNMNEYINVNQTYNPVYCFFCLNGIERSTFAMASAALVMYNKIGYPAGTRPEEQERVSIANAEYTMGKFLAVKYIIMLLPDGYQIKREVDFVLDKLFEPMSTTHFHLREMIFVTYNQAQKSKSPKNQKELYTQSLLLLERYIYLILFNGYLHTENKPRRKTFRQWMEKDCKRVGVYKLLNDLGFHDFHTETSGLSTLRERWRELNKLDEGEFV